MANDPRRPAAEILSADSQLDVLLINPESTFARVPQSPFALPSDALRLSSSAATFMGDQDHEPNHGILQVAGRLARAGFAVDLLDFNSLGFLIRNDALEAVDFGDLLQRAIAVRSPKVVGVSAMTPNFYLAQRYADVVRRLAPQTPQVLGGLATEANLDLFADSSFDVIHVGPITDAISDLVEALIRQGRVSGGPCTQVQFLQELRSPLTSPFDSRMNTRQMEGQIAAYELLPREIPLIPRVFMSYGCAAGCTFCSPAAALGYRVTNRTADSVMSEIDELHRRFDFDFWLIGDLTFNLSNQQVTVLLNELLPRASVKPWWCQTQVILTSGERFERLREANCKHIAVGFEDFASPEPAVARKHGSFERSAEACRMAKDCGLLTQGYWMFGLPNDSFDAAIKRIQDVCWFVRSRLMDTAHISFLVPYPGTAYFDRASDFGISLDVERYKKAIATATGYYNSLPVHNTRHLSAEQIFVLTRLAMASVSSEFYRLDQKGCASAEGSTAQSAGELTDFSSVCVDRGDKRSQTEEEAGRSGPGP